MRRSIVLLSITVALASCTGASDGQSPSPAGRTLKVAFLEDLSLENATSMVVPAFQGAKLAIDAADRSGLGIDLVAEDTGGDPAKALEIARELASDPSVIAVIVGPFLTDLRDVAEILGRAGMPVLSLATDEPSAVAQGSASWFQWVADAQAEAGAIAVYMRPLSGGTLCYVGSGSGGSSQMAGLVAAAVGGRAALVIEVPEQGVGSSAFATEVSKAGCRALFWEGSGPEAAEIRLGLEAAGQGNVTLVGTDAMKDPAFLSEAGPAGDGTVVACACVDLTTATDPASRRFVQNYQADFGLPPGPYAAEAHDLGAILTRLVNDGAGGRAEVLDALSSSLDCPAGACGSDDQLVLASGQVNLFVDQGGRWIQVSG